MFDMNKYKIYLFHIIYYIFLMCTIINFLINPGIPERKYYIKNIKIDKSKQYLKCKKCNIITPKELEINHCNDCGICFLNHNHHCLWIGKCIGKGNSMFFYLFILCLISYIFISIYVLFSYFKSLYYYILNYNF